MQLIPWILYIYPVNISDKLFKKKYNSNIEITSDYQNDHLNPKLIS